MGGALTFPKCNSWCPGVLMATAFIVQTEQKHWGFWRRIKLCCGYFIFLSGNWTIIPLKKMSKATFIGFHGQVVRSPLPRVFALLCRPDGFFNISESYWAKHGSHSGAQCTPSVFLSVLWFSFRLCPSVLAHIVRGLNLRQGCWVRKHSWPRTCFLGWELLWGGSKHLCLGWGWWVLFWALKCLKK